MGVSMRRSLAIAAVFAGLVALPAWGQRRGGGGLAGHSPSGFRGSAIGSSRVVSRGGFRPGPGNSFRPPFFLANRFGRNRFFFGGYPWSYPYLGAYYIDPGYYADYPDQGYSAPPSYVDNGAQIQQDQIDRLEDEVDRLREERENRSQPPAKPEPQAATLLVFQDQHSEEVHNYAIVGQTLWIFTEVKARKVLLSDLDIPATTKANQDRGVDFSLPE